MITGMTGFGASEITFGKVKGVVEIKTVNHRYLDVAFYLPVGFSSTGRQNTENHQPKKSTAAGSRYRLRSPTGRTRILY